MEDTKLGNKNHKFEENISYYVDLVVEKIIL